MINWLKSLIMNDKVVKTKRNIVIDTNILYYYLKIEKCNKLNIRKLNKLLKRSNIHISKLSIYEIIAKYHCNNIIINEIFSNNKLNNITIDDNEYCKEKVSIKQLSTISQSQLNELWNKIKHNKVEIESEMSSVFLMALLINFTYYYCDSTTEKICEILKYINEYNEKYVLKEFRSFFENVYEEENTEELSKNEFERIFKIVWSSLVTVIEDESKIGRVNDNYLIDDDADDKIEERIEIIMKKIDKKTNLFTYIQREYKNNIKNSKTYNIFFKSYKDSYLNYSDLLQSDVLKEYVTFFIEKGMNEAKRFKKNDIIDALLLSSIKSEEVFLTMDSEMKTHMENIGIFNSSIIENKKIVKKHYRII